MAASTVNPANLQSIFYFGASNLSVSIVAINLTKTSFATTLLPLTNGKTKFIVWGVIVTLTLLAIPIIVMPWIQCKPLLKTYINSIPGECIDKMVSVRFALFQAIWAAGTDFLLALLPWTVIWNLNMRKIEKVGVGIAMSLGIL